MEAEQAQVNQLLDTLKAYKEGRSEDAASAQSAYDQLATMGASHDAIMDAIAPAPAPPPEPGPEPEDEPGAWDKVKGAVAKVPAYFSGDEKKPELPEGQKQATAPQPAEAPRPHYDRSAELRDEPKGIDVPGLFNKFVTGAKDAFTGAHEFLRSANESDPIGGKFQGDKDFDLAGTLATIPEKARELVKNDPMVFGKPLVRTALEGITDNLPGMGTLKKLSDAHARLTDGPILDPESDFAKNHPTIYGLANEMIEDPRQAYYGATVRGPRMTLETAEKLTGLYTGEANKSPLAEDIKAFRERNFPEEQEAKNQPQTFGQEIFGGVGEMATSDAPTMLALMSAFGPAVGMAMFQSLKYKMEDPAATGPRPNKEPPKPEGEESILDDVKALPATIARNAELLTQTGKGFAMGKLAEVGRPFTRPVQATTMGSAAALDTLAQGGSARDAAVSGLTMAGVAAQGDAGKVGFREGAKDSFKNYVEKPVAKAREVVGKMTEREYDPRPGMFSKLKTILPDIPDPIINFMVDRAMPIATDPNAPKYDARVAEKQRLRDERRQKRAAQILADRVNSSDSPAPVTPDEVDNAVRTADAMETKGEATPAPKVSEGIQQHPGFIGVAKGKILFDLTKAELHPDEMQYKRTGTGGVTNRLKGIKFFSAKAAGSPPPVLWFNSPNRKDGVVGDGSVWVVDGHHRGERAPAMDAHDPVEVEILDGAEYTPAEARIYGALSNIRLGNGTPTDAAKLFREAGLTVADLEREGLSPTDEKIIKPALGLAKLNDALFRKVVLGEMPEALGAEIGEMLPDHDMQNALLHGLGTKKGKAPSHATIMEMARDIAESPMGEARRNGQMMLGEESGFDPEKWGVGKESLHLEKAELSARILDALREEARHFRRLSDKDLAERAKQIGSDIDTERAKENAQIASQIEGVYRKLSRGGGPISEVLVDAARRVREGAKLRDVAKETYGSVREAVMQEISGMRRGDELPGADEPTAPSDTATGDMFGGGGTGDTPVAPDDKTSSMFGTDSDPAADAQPTGDDGAILPDDKQAAPTWEDPKGKKEWADWTKERRGLSDEQLLAEIERVRALAGKDSSPKVGAGRGVAILEKMAEKRGIDIERIELEKPREVIPDPPLDEAPTDTSDEPADPLANLNMDEAEFDAHVQEARGLSDAALKKTIADMERAVVLGAEDRARALPIYEEELRTRIKDREEYGDTVTFGTEDGKKVEPAWESPEAETKFAATMDRWGDGELRKHAEKWSGMRNTNRPEILARIDAMQAELERRGMRKVGAPPPDEATTPGSMATPSERLRARARTTSIDTLERTILRDEAKAERMPKDSPRRAALLERARIMREVMAEKQGVDDPVVGGKSKAIGKRARMLDKAREMPTQELVDWIARPDVHPEWKPIYEKVLEERASGGELPPKPSTEKKQRSTTEKGGKKKTRKSTDPENPGRLGGIDPEDEPVGPSAYARRDGVVEQEDYGPEGIKAAPGVDPEVETPSGIPDDLPPRTAPPEADEVPVGRISVRSIFGLRRPTTPAGVDELVRRADIVRELAKKLKVPIRKGRISMRRALGIYKVRPEVIRTQLLNDIATVAHEIGHHIDKRVFSNPPSGPMQGPPWNRQPANFGVPVSGRMGGIRGHTFDAFRHELHPLATPGVPGPEGFAEFVSMYVTHPTRAARLAPNFYRFFESNVQRRAPEVLEALLDARRDFERYLRQPATQRVLSNISIGEYHDKPAGQRGWYHNWVEDIAPLREFRDAVNGPNTRDWKFKEQEWSRLDAMEDPYVLTRLLAGWVGKADAFIGRGRKGALDFATLRRVHRPLEEVLGPVRDFNDLRAYMIARRTIEVGSRPMGRRIETGVTMAEARATIQEVERREPHIRQVFDEMREIQDAALKYLSDSGMIPRATYERIRNANYDYVPLYRLMEDDVEAGFQRRKRATNEKEVVDLQSPIYRLKGSDRMIVDPLESVVKNIYTYVYLAERNKVGQSLVELARRTHGSGYGVEEIPHDMVPAAMLRPEEIPDIVMREFRTALQALNDPSGNITQEMIDRARTAMSGHGFNMTEIAKLMADIQNAQQGGHRGSIIRDAVNEVRRNLEIATPQGLTPIFRPGMDKKGEPIVAVRFEPSARYPSGEVYLRLSPELFQVVKGLDAETAGTITKMLAPLARGLRAGVILSPEFGLPNLIRDQFTAFLQSRNGFVPVLDTIRGLGHLIGNTELARDFYISGGAMAELTAMDRKYLQHSIQDSISASGGQLTRQDLAGMSPLDRWRGHLMNLGNRAGVPAKGTFYLSHPIEALRLLTEYSENATRIGEYARGIRNAQRAGVTSRREQMARAGYAAREVTIDFARAGAKARQINKIIAFWNVAVQGPDRLLAAAKRDPVGFNIRAIASITLPSAILWAMNKNDPRVDELDDRTKDLHFVFPMGTVTREQWSAMTDEEKAEYNLQHPIYIAPKPYEAGLIFGSLVERTLDWMYDKDPKALERWISSVWESVVPGIMPSAVGPMYEAGTNHSGFRGSSLVPRSLEDVEAIEQKTNYTSSLAVKIAEAMNTIPMGEFMGKTMGLQSPIKIENYIRGYLGGSGRIISDVASAMIDAGNTNVDPEKTLADRFLWRRFVRRFPAMQGKSVEEFYDGYAKTLEAEATKRLYEKQGDDAKLDILYERRGVELDAVDMMAATAKQLADLRTVADGFRTDDSLSPREKRLAIDAVAFEAMQMAREANEDFAEMRREAEREKKGLPLETEPSDPAPKPKPAPPPPAPPKQKPYDPPDVTDALKRGELKPRDLADFADYHRKQAQGGQ